MNIKAIGYRRMTEALSLVFLSACTVTPPAVSTLPNDPSNPAAAESVTPLFRPGLVAGATTTLGAKTRVSATPAPRDAPKNQAEREVASEMKDEPAGVAPTSEQLQSIHPSGYTCPMHPEVRSDAPGNCPKCGMALVARESREGKGTPGANQP
ncbi:MAG TPA: heavy metal-binding domain-containing protein [Chthoniobacterales bacterium]|nr:heavy metal-binding domain-containing protein [Chthoniobacterales bacterium]